MTALHSAGLDPRIGTLHAESDNRPSLALDLLEEFRPLVADQVVIEAARQQRLQLQHARSEDGRTGVFLTKAGRDAMLDGYERRMLQVTRGALPGFSGSIRRHLYRQAERLVPAIHAVALEAADRALPWTGLSWR